MQHEYSKYFWTALQEYLHIWTCDTTVTNGDCRRRHSMSNSRLSWWDFPESVVLLCDPATAGCASWHPGADMLVKTPNGGQNTYRRPSVQYFPVGKWLQDDCAPGLDKGPKGDAAMPKWTAGCPNGYWDDHDYWWENGDVTEVAFSALALGQGPDRGRAFIGVKAKWVPLAGALRSACWCA